MEDLRQAAEHANVAITAASHSLQRADRYLAQLYSERLREVGRRCALVAGCPRSAATLLFDERQRGAEFEGLVVPPLGALTLKCTRDTRRLLPFASLHDLDFIFIHRADLAQSEELASVLEQWRQRRGSFGRLVLTTATGRGTCDWFARERDFPQVQLVTIESGEPLVNEAQSILRFKALVSDEEGDWTVKKDILQPLDCAQRIRQAQAAATQLCREAKKIDEPIITHRALTNLFLQFPQSLAEVNAKRTKRCLLTMTPLQWFVEVNKFSADSLPDRQLPRLVFGHDAVSVADSNLARARAEDLGNKLLERIEVETLEFAPTLDKSARKFVWEQMACVLPSVLVLRVGMPVVLLVDLSNKLRAGEVGLITSFENGRSPEVTFPREGAERETLAVDRVTTKLILGTSLKSPVWVKVTQFPLGPAYQVTDVLTRVVPLRSSVVVDQFDEGLQGHVCGMLTPVQS